jgi:hypothetical protein
VVTLCANVFFSFFPEKEEKKVAIQLIDMLSQDREIQKRNILNPQLSPKDDCGIF